ncbi:hypothetical protein HK101_011032 [Irineochytrium annulatum]|nr:hypothetical protein HK101_011032 [Irineochytrium annulatum]
MITPRHASARIRLETSAISKGREPALVSDDEPDPAEREVDGGADVVAASVTAEGSVMVGRPLVEGCWRAGEETLNPFGAGGRVVSWGGSNADVTIAGGEPAGRGEDGDDGELDGEDGDWEGASVGEGSVFVCGEKGVDLEDT